MIVNSQFYVYFGLKSATTWVIGWYFKKMGDRSHGNKISSNLQKKKEVS